MERDTRATTQKIKSSPYGKGYPYSTTQKIET